VAAVGTFRLETTVNGQDVRVEVAADRRLIDLLRLDLGLTGTKESCGIGVCGACSVLIDGRLMSACLLIAPMVHGRRVTTIEGLADDGELTPIQDAFLHHGGLQCGFCTPGQVMAASALLDELPDPSEDDVREWLSGNLCRCTGYRSIVESVLAAAADRAARPTS
jgi:aerobic carbon-monoxide dehydrogenase small subunit